MEEECNPFEWNKLSEIKYREKLVKDDYKCKICGDLGEKVRCNRCEGKVYHYLCSKCFGKMTAEIHDKYWK